MEMDRLRRVSNVWNWLPAYRVVAEYGSIQKAALVLNVSPSALSRTVKLLEDAIGERLFVRSATGMTLTTFGADLLKGTRDAMRRIDDVVAAVGGDGDALGFVVGAHGPGLPRLLDCALARIVTDFDDVRYHTTSVDDEGVVAELLRGNLDFAIVEGGSGFDHPPEITSRHVGDLEFAILAPSTHPIASDPAAALSTTKLVTLARVAARHERATGAPGIVAVAASMESAERIAERGPYLALLPLALAPPSFRVVLPSATTMSVLALYRTPLENEAPALVRALVHAVSAVSARAE